MVGLASLESVEGIDDVPNSVRLLQSVTRGTSARAKGLSAYHTHHVPLDLICEELFGRVGEVVRASDET